MRDCRSIAFMVHNLDKKINRRLVAYGEELGIDDVTIMNGWIIGYLYDHQDQDTYQRDIEAKFSIARSTVTGIIQVMEKKGFIKRETVASDARLKKLVLTPKGVDIHKRTMSDFDAVERDLLKGLTKEDLENFAAIYKKLLNNIE